MAKKKKHNSPVTTSGPTASQKPVDEAAMNAMMKARLAYAHMFGNPASQRLISPTDNPYDFGNGDVGTHFMSSIDNYAVLKEPLYIETRLKFPHHLRTVVQL